jgi:hypothetical protein
LPRRLPLLLRHDRGGCSSRDAVSHVPCLCLFACCHLISPYCFLKQTETIRSDKFSEFGDANHQSSSRRSGSGDLYCCACNASRAHMCLLRTSNSFAAGAYRAHTRFEKRQFLSTPVRMTWQNRLVRRDSKDLLNSKSILACVREHWARVGRIGACFVRAANEIAASHGVCRRSQSGSALNRRQSGWETLWSEPRDLTVCRKTRISDFYT